METAFRTCTTYAIAAFGNGSLYLDKFIEAPRHFEIQVLADMHGNAVHLGNCDCSVQRHNQKLIKEAPSPAVDNRLCQKMVAAAVDAALAIGYVGAWTVAFLFDESGDLYLMEMNRRIPVEHPVTEMITAVDLIAQQGQVAESFLLPFTPQDIVLRAHSIGARIKAEDALHNFRPIPGLDSGFLPPGRNGVRWDGQMFTGWRIPPNQAGSVGSGSCCRHPQVALRTRRNCLQGVPTTIPFQEDVLDNATFHDGAGIYTEFIEEHILQQLRTPNSTLLQKLSNRYHRLRSTMRGRCP